METIKNRYDFVYIFDVQDGNPNGDPDAGNLPRIDPETGLGLVTDVCLKRKIRNYVSITGAGKPGYDIFVKEKGILNEEIAKAYKENGVNLEDSDHKKDKKGKGTEVEDARKTMCRNYYDIRTFGAVMSTGANAGQVRGPVQFTFARSASPIVSLEHAITRMAVATKEEAEKQSGDNRTMGRKITVPYGLYVAHGFISANFAAQTGFSEDDLKVLWSALENMFEHDRSAARGLMSARKLVIFKHDSSLGNAPAHKLFSMVKVQKKNENEPARSYEDYQVSVDKSSKPEGVEIIEKDL